MKRGEVKSFLQFFKIYESIKRANWKGWNWILGYESVKNKNTNQHIELQTNNSKWFWLLNHYFNK